MNNIYKNDILFQQNVFTNTVIKSDCQRIKRKGTCTVFKTLLVYVPAERSSA